MGPSHLGVVVRWAPEGPDVGASDCGAATCAREPSPALAGRRPEPRRAYRVSPRPAIPHRAPAVLFGAPPDGPPARSSRPPPPGMRPAGRSRRTGTEDPRRLVRGSLRRPSGGRRLATVRASVVPSVHPSRSRLPWMRRTMQTPPGPVGSLRPAIRARLLRRLVRGQHQGRAQPRAGAHRPRRPDQPRAPRATGAEADTGDGAGILVQIPDRFLRAVSARRASSCPPAGAYAVGMAFLPADPSPPRRPRRRSRRSSRRGPRRPRLARRPVDPTASAPRRGRRCRASAAVDHRSRRGTGIDLDRKAFVARKRIEHELDAEIATYFPSLSPAHARLQGDADDAAAAAFFPDLSDERFESALLLVHSRFSTNTFPSWPLAHPYRFIAHNGEINTVQGNQNWMRAREAMPATAP